LLQWCHQLLQQLELSVFKQIQLQISFQSNDIAAKTMKMTFKHLTSSKFVSEHDALHLTLITSKCSIAPAFVCAVNPSKEILHSQFATAAGLALIFCVIDTHELFIWFEL